MASRDQNTILASPFKFGFFAGIGFFFASILMSVITFIVLFLLGIGTLTAIGARGTQVQANWHNVPAEK